MSRPRNLLVAHGGGPSPVINNTLRGIVETAKVCSQIDTIYAARQMAQSVASYGTLY